MTEATSLPSLLQRLMVGWEKETGLHLSFDDLTGMFTGVHNDVTAMKVDEDHQFHSCAFCIFAKASHEGHMDCIRNKLAVNRLIIRREKGLSGICHLGLFDMAEPLIYENKMLGIFFFGSVLIKGQEKRIRKRIQRYCAKRGYDPKAYFKELKKMPVINAKKIPHYQEVLRTLVQLTHYLCKTAGVRPELYKTKALKLPYLDPQELPYIVKETMHYANAHLHEPFIVKDLASHLRCHPDSLSRKFKQYTGMDLSLYLQRIRVERAKKLLENPKITINDAADQSGFSDRVHFGKVFRRLTGETPGQYQKSLFAN